MKKIWPILFSLFGIVAANAMAMPSNPNVDCGQYKGNHPFAITLNPNTNVLDALVSCMKSAKINYASITGELDVINPEFAYFDLKNKKFLTKKFQGVYEVVGLTGNFNLTLNNPKLKVNIHAAIVDNKHKVVGGGHLLAGTTGATGTFTIFPLQNS